MSATRESRLFVRTDASEKSRIEYAAKLAHLSVSDFVRVAVEDKAETVISAQFYTTLSPTDFQTFHDALDRPDVPNEARRRAAGRSRAFVQK